MRGKQFTLHTTCKMGSLTCKTCPTGFLAPGSAGVLGTSTHDCRWSGHGGNGRCRRTTEGCSRAGGGGLVARVGRRGFGFDHGRVSA